ncbi:MAG: hypothetical protein IJT12_08555 [Paludibacteraceae bacterium]|nr:hypothetical protein [Paludibacteraceae bacterium]
MKRIWFALIMVGAAALFSGCAVKNEPDSSTRQGGGRPDPNTLRITTAGKQIPSVAVKTLKDAEKETVTPEELR